MHIYVKVLKGSECEVTVSSSHTVLDVKGLLQDQVSIPIDQQKLIYQGKSLSDEKYLGHYNIKDGAKLFLLLKKPGGGKTPNTSTSTPSLTPAATPMTVDPGALTPITDDPVGFWEKLSKFLRRHFTEKDAEKVLHQFKKDFDASMSKMSLDDIERLAANRLRATEGYFHQRLSS